MAKILGAISYCDFLHHYGIGDGWIPCVRELSDFGYEIDSGSCDHRVRVRAHSKLEQGELTKVFSKMRVSL